MKIPQWIFSHQIHFSCIFESVKALKFITVTRAAFLCLLTHFSRLFNSFCLIVVWKVSSNSHFAIFQRFYLFVDLSLATESWKCCFSATGIRFNFYGFFWSMFLHDVRLSSRHCFDEKIWTRPKSVIFRRWKEWMSEFLPFGRIHRSFVRLIFLFTFACPFGTNDHEWWWCWIFSMRGEEYFTYWRHCGFLWSMVSFPFNGLE